MLANDGFDTLVLVMSVAMSPTNGNEGCRARNEFLPDASKGV